MMLNVHPIRTVDVRISGTKISTDVWFKRYYMGTGHLMNPSGGIIGYGATCPRLHKYLKRCKSFRLHAIFHDAMGFYTRRTV